MNICLPRGAFSAAVMAAMVASSAYAQDAPPAATTQPSPGVPPVATGAPQPSPDVPPAPTGAPQPAAHVLDHAEIDRLLAPIALYPDQLVSQILMASTYPLEVVEAARWVKVPANQQLRGDALTDALKQQNWDPAVMALIPFPRVLANMDADLDWTKQLGDVFLAQQANVMESVQRLRQQALAAGNLKETTQCGCRIKNSGGVVTIAAANPDYFYVPAYNPNLVYGAWAYPEYPPFVFPIPVGFSFEPGLPYGFYPGIDIALFGPIWGWSSLDWGARSILVDPGRFAAIAPNHAAFAGGVWAHDPSHRGNVAYSNPAVAARFNSARVEALTRGRSFDRPFNAANTPGRAFTHQAIGAPRPGGSTFHGNSAFHPGGGPASHPGVGFRGAPAFHPGAAGFRGAPAAQGAPRMRGIGVSGSPRGMGGGGAPHFANPGGGHGGAPHFASPGGGGHSGGGHGNRH